MPLQELVIEKLLMKTQKQFQCVTMLSAMLVFWEQNLVSLSRYQYLYCRPPSDEGC